MVAARVTTGLAGRVARACIAALFRDKSLPTPRSRYTPRQNSPSTAKIARFGLFWARWAKNFAFATRALPAGRIFSRRPQPTSRAGYPHRYKTLPAHGVHGRNRYKTLPAHGVHELNRYKTLPASRKTPISALLTRAGRKLSRSGRKLPEQGELFPGADANNPSRENLLPQTTTHQPRSAHAPVQNSPGTRHARPQPVQNSPHTAKNAHFGPFSASREKNIPVQTQTTRAGRIFSRRPPLTSHAGHAHRYKTLRAIPASRPTGTKLSQHREKRPFRPI